MSEPGADAAGGAPRRARSGWIAAAALIGVLVVLTLSAARTDGLGARGLPAGTRMPDFAAPLAESRLEGDANVTQPGAGARPACAVRGRDVLNICELAERRPVALAFVATRPARCLDQLDVLDRVARDLPRVAFAAVVVRGDRTALRRVVRRRGWATPVAHDRDGAVSNLYGVGVCPTVVFARRGGVVRETAFGLLRERELRRRAARLR